MTRRPRTSTLFPYTTLFRSVKHRVAGACGRHEEATVRGICRLEAVDKLRADLVVPLPDCRPERGLDAATLRAELFHRDRKSTRLNSSHVSISYAVFCLKKKK